MKDALACKGNLSEGILPFVNPATGEIFGQVEASSLEEARRAVFSMRAASTNWAKRPVKDRLQVMQKLYRCLLEQADSITDVITQDTGKPRQDALIELYTCLNYFHTLMKKAPAWLREERIATGLQFMKRAWVRHQPHGVVAVIAPWNYPLLLMMNPTLGALAAGNSVVVKPSEVTPAVAAYVQQLLQAIPILDEVVRFAYGDARIGAAVVEAAPDMIFITGSAQTGQAISRAAAESLTPVVCELGGKDPMLVLEDADLDAAARWGAWGAFSNSGQTCISPERVYVHEAVYDSFLAELKAEVERIRIGYSRDVDGDYHYGTMTFPAQCATVEAHITDALRKGARVVTGGARKGMLLPPTVLADVNDSMLVMQEETFGPVLPVIRVKNDEEAVARANDSPFGLSGSVFSENPTRARRVAEALQVGSVNINDTMSHYALPELPFGGVGLSGNGRSNGREGLLAFTNTHAYVRGKPHPWDIATRVRKPGSYQLVRGLMLITLAPSLEQKMTALKALLRGGKSDPMSN